MNSFFGNIILLFLQIFAILIQLFFVVFFVSYESLGFILVFLSFLLINAIYIKKVARNYTTTSKIFIIFGFIIFCIVLYPLIQFGFATSSETGPTLLDLILTTEIFN